ncbi:Fic/DOC family protein [Pseudomonas putida]|uniref:protein adenylyltransferase n=1 Tax=Pseudomonas putida TaxID=303 RepID=A0A7Y8D0Q0_PSEPU|nr:MULTISPECIES: Fic family protein [Pseudomonas]KAF1312305.1 cell filamentation protein Fic [Pseudomonas sp. SG-MS2]KHL73861.1 cell division protein Fic [Pseudomonas putida]NWC79774.1 Fic family protein [Pseudomonas putida]
MSSDKYGSEQDSECYPGTDVLINLLELHDPDDLEDAERYLSALAASRLEFLPPPYSLDSLKQIHSALFSSIYSWAGRVRSSAISKGSTRFCSPEFIEPETRKEFSRIAAAGWFEGYSRDQLITAVAEAYGTLNVAHPFREGNGRAQRILFEWIIVNAGFSITWEAVERDDWIHANILSYHGDDGYLVQIFARCIGQPILEND